MMDYKEKMLGVLNKLKSEYTLYDGGELRAIDDGLFDKVADEILSSLPSETEIAKGWFDTWRHEYLASEEVEIEVPYRVLDFPDYLDQQEAE